MRRKTGFRGNRGSRGFRQKQKLIWFPNTGLLFEGGEDSSTRGYNLVPGLQAPASRVSSEASLATFSLIPDYTQERSAAIGTTQGPNLRDFVEGQSARIRRIVGKIYLHCFAGSTSVTRAFTWSQVLVKAGIFIARADDEDQSEPDLFSSELNPFGLDNVQDPWLWQRTWNLANPQYQGDLTLPTLPTSTQVASDIQSGAHVDVKCNRIIKREERLWMTIAVEGGDPSYINVSGNDSQQPAVSGTFDFRVLGTMMKARSKGSF